uniref:Uncharacterized protein n=1 Tax=Pararge aegeria TaxID=116150 RepID=S4P1Z6_9NEOP
MLSVPGVNVREHLHIVVARLVAEPVHSQVPVVALGFRIIIQVCQLFTRYILHLILRGAFVSDDVTALQTHILRYPPAIPITFSTKIPLGQPINPHQHINSRRVDVHRVITAGR